MKRLLWAVLVGCLAAALPLAPRVAGLAAQEQDFSKVEIHILPVSGHIYMLNGTGGNVGVSVGRDGILIVDDKFAPLAEKIRAALQEIVGEQPAPPSAGPADDGATGSPAASGKLKFILNTHWHGDHTGANPVFGPEVPIIAQTNVRKRLMTEQHIFGRAYPPLAAEGWPVITFDQSVSVHFNGEEIKVIHFPHGHTDGDSVIFFTGSNVVHLGDDFFAGRFPFVDLGSGGSVEGLIEDVGELIQQIPPDAKLIPGHGPISTLDDLKAYHHMLVATTDIVRQRRAAGESLEQIKAEGLPEEWKPWGAGFITTDRWLETIYNSLTNPVSGGN